LPAGLYAPYLSADNNLTSQITAAGVQFTQKLARQLLAEGLDWQPSGVITRKFARQYGEPEQWHPDAGWIKPAALVKACLSQANVAWRGNCDVKRLACEGEIWTLLSRDNEVLLQANMVVIAAANQSADLLHDLPHAPKLNFQAVRGQVTYGRLEENLNQDESSQGVVIPINGGGSYIETDTEWLIGATYDRDNRSLDANIRDQVENFERLESLVPDIAAQLKPNFARGMVNNWVGIRCATTDRLPVVGEITQGLWILTALASRGLTFAPICAELLAAQLHDELLPLNVRQVKALSVQRYMKR
jgi:tRNA 5-methylaminomethyl-2-thiouridine biosynthesis bifunctional protein